MKEPIIVTAFWDVGRGKGCEIPRSNERYYKEFAEWARIQNTLIVYTDKYSEKEIFNIRSKYGLQNKTKIIVNDIFEIEKDLFTKMKDVEKNKSFIQFRYRPEAMENKAKFDYAWFMKYWCISDAAKLVDSKDILAWFGFGFNHLNKCYINMEEFSFVWSLNKEVSSVEIYSLKSLDEVEIIDILQFMRDTVMGVFFLVPVKCAEEFWLTVRKAMLALLMIGCIDDDQVLVLMAYKWRPDLIHVNVSKWWYLALKENGASHLTVKSEYKDKSVKHKIWAKKYDYKHKKSYLKRTKERMKKFIDSAL